MIFDYRRRFVLGCLAVSILLGFVLIQSSGQQGGGYNPWLDYNDDGIIDVGDLQVLGHAYGSSGTPLNMPMALKYDSGWINITDKKGQDITITPNVGDLKTSAWTPLIYGKIKVDSPWHQRFFDGTGSMPGWNKTYEGTNYNAAQSMVQTSDGGYALAGLTESYGAGGSDFWLVKTDSSGNAQWNKTYGGGQNDGANSLVQTSDGGYALAGWSYSAGLGTPTYTNFWLVKTDSSGNRQWQKYYGGEYDDCAYSLVQTSDGGYALAGYICTHSLGAWYNRSYDFCLVKTDSSGNMQWNNIYGKSLVIPPGISDTRPYSLVQTSDGGYAIAGCYNHDAYLVKTDAYGLMEASEGLSIKGYTADTLTLYRARSDPYWNYVRVRIWVAKENP